MNSLERRLAKLELAVGEENREMAGRTKEELAFFVTYGYWPGEHDGRFDASDPLHANYLKLLQSHETGELIVMADALLWEQRDQIWERCGKQTASFEEGPLLWLTQYTKTEDNHWMHKGTQPVAPFPKKDYFIFVMEWILKTTRMLIPKSREMMTSWLSCAYIAWQCQWYPQISWLIQADKLDKAIQLVNYCRILYRHQEPWMKQRYPIVTDNRDFLELANGSWIRGIPYGVNQVRSYHPTGYLMDEAAHLPEAEECFNIAAPVAKQIIGVSSMAPGWFANMCALG